MPLRPPFVRLVALSIALACLPAAARGAVPEPSAPPAPAAPDTSQFLPRWLHVQAGVGFGWISSPVFLRQRYEAGEGFEAGLEARMRPNLRLRLNGEYQVLPAVGLLNVAFVSFTDVDGGQVVDTLSFDWRRAGWLGSIRTELQWRALPHTWLLLGAGRGYLNAGVRPYHFRDPFVTLDVEFPGSSGWAWTTSAGARYDFDIFGPVLGVETRWSSLDRPQDRLQTWSIRIGWQGK